MSGNLDGAIHQIIKDAEKANSTSDVESLVRAMTLQKEKMDAWVNKARNLIQQKELNDARNALSLAPTISVNYPPYISVLSEIQALEDELKYPKQILFNGKTIEPVFSAYDYDAKLADYGSFENGVLHINIPENHSWGRVGLVSKEPLAVFDSVADKQGYRFEFNFIDRLTSGYVIELDAVDSQADIKITYKPEGNGMASIRLDASSGLSQKAFVSNDKSKRLSLVLYPNQYCYAQMADALRVETSFYSQGTPKKGYLVKVYSQSEKHKLPAQMGLESISMARIPVKTVEPLSNLSDSNTAITLFDGKNFNRQWIPYPRVKHSDMFGNFVTLTKGMLVADVGPKNNWGEVGIGSPEPLIWLDKLDQEGTQIHTTVRFDPEKTTGFSIVAGDINSSWKSPGNKIFMLTWTPLPESQTSQMKLKILNKEVLTEILPITAPSQVTFGFTQGMLSIETDGLEKKSVACPMLVADYGLHMWVTSLAGKKDAPVTMALKEITLNRVIEKKNMTAKVIPPIPPLPVKTLFGADQLKDWECFEGKDRIVDCAMQDKKVNINVSPEEKTIKGIRSKKDVIVLDKRRIDKGRFQIVLAFDPGQTDAFDIGLGKHHVVLKKDADDQYLFSLGDRQRTINTKWLQTQWNGRIMVQLSKLWIKAVLDGSVGIHLFENPKLTMPIVVSSIPPKEISTDGCRMALQMITKQWVMPEDATAAHRWNYVDDEDFNPDEFLRELKGALK
ncbi:hypothetical protein [Desulforapulum autotrophicum]|nr:hypothetical protein [Desulforapulum autotrophicum]